MTTVVSLFGGPGTGKSTTAARLFSEMKLKGCLVELVFEYAKTWAWQERTPSKYDEFKLFGEQSYRESVLYGKVDWVVTDRPLSLGGFYARQFGLVEVADALDKSAAVWRSVARADGHEFLDVFLIRSKAYDSRGRFQSEQEARDMDAALRSAGDFDLYSGTTDAEVRQLCETICSKGWKE